MGGYKFGPGNKEKGERKLEPQQEYKGQASNINEDQAGRERLSVISLVCINTINFRGFLVNQDF